MPEYTFKEALELQLKTFASSTLSFLAAISIDRALYDYLGKKQTINPYTFLIASIVLVTLAMGILTLMVWADPSDIEVPQSRLEFYQEEREKIKELFKMHPFHQQSRT